MTPAFAILLAVTLAAPEVHESDGAVRVGKEGAWRDAAKDMAIGEDEFLSLDEGAHATVTLRDGTSLSFTGKRVVPGRRLAKSGAAKDVFFSDALRSAASLLVIDERVSSTPGTTKNCNDEDRRLGKCTGTGAPQFDSAAADASVAIAGAEKSLALGKSTDAKNLAEQALEGGSATDVARAHCVLGAVAAGDGNFETALREFDLVSGDTLPAPLRARAKLGRARAEIDLGDVKSASADLEAARTLDSGKIGHRATLLLEGLALESGDRARAESLARELRLDRDLAADAQSLLRK